MNNKINLSDQQLNEMLFSWKEDFETPNPFLSEKIIHSFPKTTINLISFKLTKISVAAIITIGLISGYLLFSITENFTQNQEGVITEENNSLIEYKNDIYISELKYSEIENLLSEK